MPLLVCAQRNDAVFFNMGYNFRGYFVGTGYNLSLSRPRDDQWRLIAEGQLSFEEFNPRGEQIPVSSYRGLLSINHGINELLKETRLHNCKSYFGLGVLLGGERINGGKRFLDSGVEITSKSKFVYGTFANLSLLIPLFSDRVDIYWKLNYKPLYIFNSDLGNFVNNLGTGIVFSID